MGRKIRRIIAVLLCVTSVVLMLLPSEPSYASVTVGDYEMDGRTLIKYKGTGDQITLPNTIQTIGKDAFSGNKSLVKVIIPDSVRDIDFAAFEDCTNLIQVVVPESVRTIGSSAFSGCDSLQYVNIPANCDSIGSGAFAKCGKLSSVTVSPGNGSFICVDGVLYSKDGSRLIQYLAGRTSMSYSMPSTVGVIDEYAFWGAGQLADISLSSRIKEIPEYAFANCSGLANVVLPYNVESLMAYSFSDCYSLKSVVIPDSVGYIDEKAFYLTKDVTVNYYDSDAARKKVEAAGVPEEQFADYIEGVSANSVGEDYDIFISGSAGEKTYLNQMPYVSSMTPDYTDNKTEGELASGKIVGGSALVMLDRNVPVMGFDIGTAETEDGQPYGVIMGNGTGGSSKGDFNILGSTLAGYSGTAAEPAVPVGIQRIGNRAFYKNDKITGASLPSGLSSIGDFAFARSSVKSVDIPTGVKKIGYAAFYNCRDLEEVKIPDSVESVELGAFDGTAWLDRWKKTRDDNDFLVAGDGILLGYKGSGSEVNVPAGIRTIAPGCFSGNTNISSITLPQGLVSIGEDAFNGCSLLKDVTIPETVTDIEDRAFKDCGLTQVIIPGGVQRIGMGAFDRTGSMGEEPDRTGAVVFLGNELPGISYKNTATRLSARELRHMPFEGYDNAVVGSDVAMGEGSILSPSAYGFRGQVYTITSEAEAELGQLRLVQSTCEPDDEGNAVIDPHVTINGKNYIMTGVGDEAFKPYEDVYGWTDRPVKSVSIAGNTSPELEKRLIEVGDTAASQSPGQAETVSETGLTSVKVNMDPGLSADKDEPHATIADVSSNYHIDIKDASDKMNEARNALINRYGSADGITMGLLDITMYDDRSGIPIKRLSGKTVDMELPIPAALTTVPDIAVAVLDDNGELRELSSSIANNGGNDKIRFVAPHFSTYIFYNRQEVTTILTMENTENMAFGRQGAVLKTLNKSMGPLAFKWYIIVILLSMAGIMFVYEGKRTGLKKRS